MKKFEYEYFKLPKGDYDSSHEYARVQKLNELGSEGWDLITYNEITNSALMKREKQLEE